MAAITTQEFEHHFKSLYKPLCLFALRYTDQVDDAEDIVQQAFADVWDKNRAGNVIGNLKAYLYQAVRNRSLSFTSQPVNAEATEQLPDVEDTSEEEDILRSERDARLWDAIDRLHMFQSFLLVIGHTGSLIEEMMIFYCCTKCRKDFITNGGSQ